MSLGEDKVKELVQEVLEDFSSRHKNIWKTFNKNFGRVQDYLPTSAALSGERRLLIGSFFTFEYSVSAAALFNPSIVLHPDQKRLKKNEARIIESFRATGEGHISSVEFRSGILTKDNDIKFDPITRYIERPEIIKNRSYDKYTFDLKLAEINSKNEVSDDILSKLPDSFTLSELQSAAESIRSGERFPPAMSEETVTNILWLADSNYEVKFSPDHAISERVLFPVSKNEKNGIEDARFVRFVDDGGEVTYYATYTAYNGYQILPQLIETKDFLHFKMITLNGEAAQNKGMALFPRKINGNYAMISRQDGENLFIMSSDNIHFWHEATLLKEPELPWEFVQIGNCGSPIETEAGWILLTHGVGPVREYSIGALLLDLEDPSKVIGRLKEPLLKPSETEREGYVPNVVYSCGGLIHNDELVIPYAMSDTSSGFAIVNVNDLLDNLTYDF